MSRVSGAASAERPVGFEGGPRALLGRLGAGWRTLLGGAARAAAPRALELARNATMGLRPRRGGLVVRCRQGTLLVTQSADPLDHVLTPGGEVKLAGRGLVAIWALEDAALTASAS